MAKFIRESVTITDDTPLRMDHAAALAFPDGSINGRTLYTEAKAGRLEYTVFAGKHYTTLRFVRESMERCRVPANPQDFGLKTTRRTRKATSSDMESGASLTGEISAAQALASRIEKLRKEHSLTRKRKTNRSISSNEGSHASPIEANEIEMAKTRIAAILLDNSVNKKRRPLT